MSDPQLLSSMLAKHSASAVAEAIANADAHTSNAGLPTYSELAEALRDAEHRLNELIATGDFEPEDLRCIRRACALLSRIPS